MNAHLSTPQLAGLLLVLFAASPASAGSSQGTVFPGPSGPLPQPQTSSSNPNAPGAPPTVVPRGDVDSAPGSAPTLVFSEERWEFWWEFNHDAWVNLRPNLRNGPAVRGSAFAPFDAAGRAQVLMPVLVELLRDPDQQVRAAAVLSLARLQDASTLPYLGNTAVGDSSLSVRTSAIVALGLARNPKAIERLKGFFFDEHLSSEQRTFAAVALGVSGLPEASAVLRDALVGGVESRLPTPVHAGAIYALGLTQDPGNAPFLRTLAQSKGLDDVERALAVESLGRVGDRAANPQLLEFLESKSMPVRRSAAVALGVVARPDDAFVLRALEKAADDDSDAVVRSFAEISLGRIASLGAPAVVDRLRARLKSATARQRPFVALALGISGYEAALPDLLAQFKQESSNSMKGALAIAIALLDQTEAAPELRSEFRETKEPQLRGYLAYALGRLGDAEITKELLEIAAKESDPQLLYWSSLALGLLGDRSVPALLAELYAKTGEQVTRASYLTAIGAIGDRDAAVFLTGIAKNPSGTEVARSFATCALGMLSDEDRVPRSAIFSRDHNYTLNLTFIPQLYYLF